MKTLCNILLLICAYSLSAQNTKIERFVISHSEPIATRMDLSLLQNTIVQEADLQSWIQNNIPNVSLFTFQVRYQTKGPKSQHYLFDVYANSFRIYHANVKINCNSEGKILSVYYNLPQCSSIPEYDISTVSLIHNAYIQDEHIYYVKYDQLYPAILRTTNIPDKAIHTEAVLINEDEIELHDLNSYAHDTLIYGYHFNPDPLTPDGITYGGLYRDFSDSATPYYNSKRVLRSVQATDTLGQFSLRSPYCQIVDLSPPNILPAVLGTDSFLFTRKDDGFEDLNTYYHVHQMRSFINDSLGFSMMNYPIQCDPHALNGNDNSLFTFSTSPPSIQFGEGGVDDAEDADVIIHEYHHAVSHDASPGTNIGNERMSIDEGFGDYMACSYSKRINPFNAYYVFNWDGHNEFWSGRFVNGTKIYPTDITSSIYNNGGIWSSALWEIESKIGYKKANTLAIQTMYANSSNIVFPQAALNYIDADSLWYNGDNYCKIVNSFIQRGILDISYKKHCDFTTVQDINHLEPLLINTYAFSQGLGPAYIALDNKASYSFRIYSTNGDLLNDVKGVGSLVEIQPNNFSAGIYIIQLHIANTLYSFKLIRYL